MILRLSVLTVGIVMLVGCAPSDEDAERLAAAAAACLERSDTAREGSVSLRVALDKDGNTILIETHPTNNNEPGFHDAQMAAMRAVQQCAPYDIRRTGEFDITITYPTDE